MESRYTGRKVLMRDTHGEWWEGTIADVIEEMGNWCYKLRTDDGEIHVFPVADITYIKAQRKGKVIPLKPKLVKD